MAHIIYEMTEYDINTTKRIIELGLDRLLKGKSNGLILSGFPGSGKTMSLEALLKLKKFQPNEFFNCPLFDGSSFVFHLQNLKNPKSWVFFDDCCLDYVFESNVLHYIKGVSKSLPIKAIFVTSEQLTNNKAITIWEEFGLDLIELHDNITSVID